MIESKVKTILNYKFEEQIKFIEPYIKLKLNNYDNQSMYCPINNNYWTVVRKNGDFKLIFIDRVCFKTFLFSYKNILKRILSINTSSTYFYKLRLKGLGFRIHILGEKLIRFFFNQSNYYYLFIPTKMIILYKERMLLLVSLQLDILKVVIAHLLLLYKLSIYRTRGLVYPTQIRIIKPGKKRF